MKTNLYIINNNTWVAAKDMESAVKIFKAENPKYKITTLSRYAINLLYDKDSL